MATAPTSKFRIFILTISVAAITATGAWYGAGLKIEQDYKKVSGDLKIFRPWTYIVSRRLLLLDRRHPLIASRCSNLHEGP